MASLRRLVPTFFPASALSLEAAATQGRGNNLNLLRALAALSVILSHSFTLATGNADLEPGRQRLGMSLGDISVDIFFVVSGFLVTKSICRSGSLSKYAAARALRILPGLWVALVVTTLAVCAWFCDAPFLRSLGDAGTWGFVARNAIVVTGAEFSFPGAFAHNPFPDTINGSLWTLPLEAWMYITLALAWIASARVSASGLPAFHRATLALAIVLTAAALFLDATGHVSHSTRHAAEFFIAAALFGQQARVKLTASGFLAAAAIVVASAFGPPLVFEAAYRVLVPYIVLYVAFVPGGVIRRYNRTGDYSYGLYIYAFPIQQMVAASMPGIAPYALFGVAAAATLACSAVSWHLVERPALSLRALIEHRRNTATGGTQ